MKVIIWLGCVFAYSVVVTALRFTGILLGGIPTFLLGLFLVVLPARALCERWDKHKAQHIPPRQEPPVPEAPMDASKIDNPVLRARAELLCASKEQPAERWYTCQKCGQLVREGEVCDCEAIRQHLEEERCHEPAAQEQEQSEAEPPEAKMPKKKKRTTLEVTLMVACCALILLSTALGYHVYKFRALSIAALEVNNGLLQENKDLEAQIKELEADVAKFQKSVQALEAENASMTDDMIKYLPDAIFLYNNIGFIVNGSNFYHNYECPIFQEADEYWAHNVEYCEYLGYSPCGRCWR